VIDADDPELVRRHMELHREWLEERLADELRTLADLERFLIGLLCGGVRARPTLGPSGLRNRIASDPKTVHRFYLHQRTRQHSSHSSGSAQKSWSGQRGEIVEPPGVSARGGACVGRLSERANDRGHHLAGSPCRDSDGCDRIQTVTGPTASDIRPAAAWRDDRPDGPHALLPGGIFSSTVQLGAPKL